jgi:sigma-E factor negative regulatory protein RseB
MRIHDAASRRNFQGTFVVSGGGNVASARMSHFCEGANQYERIESLDGKARNVFRHNDVVHTVWPASRVAVVEQRDLLTSFPALLQAGADTVGDWYELRQQDDERVAGHAANVLVVRAKDTYRYGYRLWSDKASGLLLRADVLSARGDVLETSAFSDISIGVRSQPDSVLQAMKKLDGYRVLRPVMSPTTLETEGWTVRQVVPGFRQVRCVNREMDSGGDVAGGERGASRPAGDLRRRHDVRLRFHRTVQRQPSRSADARRHGRDADVVDAAGRLVDHGDR